MFTWRFPKPTPDSAGQQAQQAQQVYLVGNCTLMWLSWVVHSLLGRIVVGMEVYLPQRLRLGW